MTAQEYNNLLLFVYSYGNLGITDFLFEKYESCFWEWYGDPIHEDMLSSTFPESDFREWFGARCVDNDVFSEDDVEILPQDLVNEIQTLVTNS